MTLALPFTFTFTLVFAALPSSSNSTWMEVMEPVPPKLAMEIKSNHDDDGPIMRQPVIALCLQPMISINSQSINIINGSPPTTSPSNCKYSSPSSILSKSIQSFNGINTRSNTNSHTNTKFIKRSQIQKHLLPKDEPIISIYFSSTILFAGFFAFNLLISTVVDNFKVTKEG
eukprot:16587_1